MSSEMEQGQKKVPIKEGLWGFSADGRPHLIGSRCRSCGELYFPKKEKGLCIHCQSQDLEDVKLSTKGKINSFTVVMIPPGGGYYKGPVPYAYGCVELPEGLLVQTLFTEIDPGRLQVGMNVEVIIEKLGEDDEGNEIATFKFRPNEQQ